MVQKIYTSIFVNNTLYATDINFFFCQVSNNVVTYIYTFKKHQLVVLLLIFSMPKAKTKTKGSRPATEPTAAMPIQDGQLDMLIDLVCERMAQRSESATPQNQPSRAKQLKRCQSKAVNVGRCQRLTRTTPVQKTLTTTPAAIFVPQAGPSTQADFPQAGPSIQGDFLQAGTSHGTQSNQGELSGAATSHDTQIQGPPPAEPGTQPSINLITSTLPLGYNVSDKVKSGIWANQYVDFDKLQPNYHDESESVQVVSGSNEIKIQTQQKTKQLYSIHQWTNSFDVFMTIYLQKHKSWNTALALIKYGNNIRNMSQNFTFQAAKVYDEEFRKLRVSAPGSLQWAVVHDELWRCAIVRSQLTPNSSFTKQNKKQPFPRGFQQKKRYPKGFCWKFCETGRCPNFASCKLKHQCVACGQKHATDTCPKNKSDNTGQNK